MPVLPDRITIGELAMRSGVATSALRFYEERGLIAAERTPGNQRLYPRPTLRRVAFIRAAQEVGLTLDEIGQALAALPTDRRRRSVTGSVSRQHGGNASRGGSRTWSGCETT